MGLFDKLLGRTSSRQVTRVTHSNPLVINSPVIGFLNLIGQSAYPLIDEDRSALASLFSGEVMSEGDPPRCDVLLVYANVGSDGVVEGSHAGLRDIVDQTNASIVIFASDNDPNGYIASGRSKRLRSANLVMTIERKGSAFTRFFFELFTAMKSGTTMPMAWVKLAPQSPGAAQGDCPVTIFSAEISHIIFK